MNRNMKKIAFVLALSLAGTAAPLWAQPQGGGDSRISKLEERVRDLEARMAKVEASSNKQMGMMQHQHGMGMQGQQPGMGMNSPMGQAPQQNQPMGSGMPQGGAPQQGGGMSAGGMGDM